MILPLQHHKFWLMCPCIKVICYLATCRFATTFLGSRALVGTLVQPLNLLERQGPDGLSVQQVLQQHGFEGTKEAVSAAAMNPSQVTLAHTTFTAMTTPVTTSAILTRMTATLALKVMRTMTVTTPLASIVAEPLMSVLPANDYALYPVTWSDVHEHSGPESRA